MAKRKNDIPEGLTEMEALRLTFTRAAQKAATTALADLDMLEKERDEHIREQRRYGYNITSASSTGEALRNEATAMLDAASRALTALAVLEAAQNGGPVSLNLTKTKPQTSAT